MNKLLSTAYWPNIQYLKEIIQAEKVVVDAGERYQKQSYRNRTRIMTANGVQDLIIPVVHDGEQKVGRVRISYKEAWNKKHWRAICSAYGNSPFFDFLEPEFAPFYDIQFEYLLDYNSKQLELLKKIFRISSLIEVKEADGDISATYQDLRDVIHPKRHVFQITDQYHQVFSDKFGFVANLSVLDLLFNAGPKALK